MHLVLPAWVQKIILRASCNQPFAGIMAELDKAARTFKTHFPGNTPTCERLATTYYPLFAISSIFTSLEAATIAGRIPASLNAQAHYYAFSRESLNIQFRKAHKVFVQRLEPLDACSAQLKSVITHMSFTGPLPTGMVGSQLSSKPADTRFLATELARQFQQGCACLWAAIQSKEKWIVHALNIQHANFYLMLQIYMALRPVGGATSISAAPGRQRAITQSKADRQSINRCLALFPEPLKMQYRACKKDITLFNLWLVDQNRQPVLQMNEPIPMHFALYVQKEIFVSRMSGRLFRNTLKALDIAHLFPERNNAWRHIAATALHRRVPEIVLDEMMAHDREGLDLAGPWSTAGLDIFSTLQEPLDQIYDEVNVNVLEIGDLGCV